jgi:carbamoyl-phosphate synthase small subunit
MTGKQEQAVSQWREPRATALLVLANGAVFEGFGLGASGLAAGEVCFNTAMTGYQEILTDPSYTGQIVTFTFPHIGNTGVNDEDMETNNSAPQSGARGVIVHAAVTRPSSYRARGGFNEWLKKRGIIGLCGLDTRALTAFIRENGMPNAVIAHSPSSEFDLDRLKALARDWPGLEGTDLVPEVSCAQRFDWTQAAWQHGIGFPKAQAGKFKVIAIDYGIKLNILRLLAETGCTVTVVPAETPADSVLAMRPDGVFLSNGPGDPAETGKYAVPVIRSVLERGVPTFGICLGHQMLALAVGAKTVKMRQGHHGANHPVQDFNTGKVEIVSMNHGFAVDSSSLPENARETHRSLFDGSNCGLELTDRPAFSVQYHPEASPGPRDSHYLFRRFTAMMEEAKSS